MRSGGAQAPARRSYDSTVRREGARQTHQRIVDAAFELLHETSIRDWTAVTMRAVATRAGVNERTVYRHFRNERALRDAVMQRFEEDAGIELDELSLGDVADVAARTLAVVAAHPARPRPPLDPTLTQADERRREALLAAVAAEAPAWSEDDRTAVAAALDTLWSVDAYERLTIDWHLDDDRATTVLTWLITLVETAVREQRPPG
jgi:AcrR family transcriptional regulator